MLDDSVSLVCFDLGGVLAKIEMTWGGAARVAGIDPDRVAFPFAGLSDFPHYDAYQRGHLSVEEYLPLLATWLGDFSVDEARATHLGVLGYPYADTDELVDELHARGLTTACLSNTNGLHWEGIFDGRFPNITGLRHHFASHLMGRDKPDPEIYRMVEAATGHSGPSVVFFDDSPVNCDAATLACGWRSFRIDPDADPARQMRGHLGLD
ncbi:MAG: HAD-IA family hydrolase [Fimbriimonadaceae bacterium]